LQRRSIWVCLLLALPASAEGPAACDLFPAAALSAPRPAGGDEFGVAVAVFEDVAVVGARSDDDAVADGGAAHVFRFIAGSWVAEQVLTASDAQNSDLLGSAVAAGAGVAVVGAPGDDDAGGAAGSAYIFRHVRGVWIEEDKLLAGDALPGDSFGTTVALDGDVAVVGAPHADLPLTNAGAVYVFRFDGAAWNFEQRLEADDAEAGDRFGIGIAAGQGRILVGAYLEDSACPEDPNCNSGAAYVFEENGGRWVQTDKLLPSDTELFDHFGCFVSLDGDAALIGAYHDNDAATSSGAAYVYRYRSGAWIEEQKLIPFEAAENDRCGWRGSLSGNRAVIGAPGHDIGGNDDTGSAYLFVHDGADWIEAARLIEPSPAEGQELGDVLTLSGDTLFAGIFRDDEAGSSSGIVQLYDLSPDSDGDGIPDACDACAAVADCADQDHDGASDDGCLWYTCGPPCSAQPRVFADLGGPQGACLPDGTADANDRFHALNCFANTNTTGGSPYPCESAPPAAFNADAGGPFGSCTPDGVCDGNDAFHTLNAFSGVSTCSCPPGGPQPVRRAPPARP
jgi:hypothetical protein